MFVRIVAVTKSTINGMVWNARRLVKIAVKPGCQNQNQNQNQNQSQSDDNPI
jgi:hypothetical protein